MKAPEFDRSIRAKYGLKMKQNVTFTKFVSYFFSNVYPNHNYDLNVHFSKQWARCDVCRFRADFVGKVETMKQDAEYLAKKLGVSFENRRRNRTLNVADGESSESLAKKLFSTLKKSVVRKLVKYFQIDFELFDYDYQEYIDIAKY